MDDLKEILKLTPLTIEEVAERDQAAAAYRTRLFEGSKTHGYQPTTAHELQDYNRGIQSSR